MRQVEEKQTYFPPPSCLLFSLVSTGVRGDSSGQEDVLCCGWGPVSDDHSGYGFVPADFSSGCRTGKSCPHKQQVFFYHPMYLSGFQSKAHQYFTDGGLLRLHDFICESGLGCRVRPPCWISGGPQ